MDLNHISQVLEDGLYKAFVFLNEKKTNGIGIINPFAAATSINTN